MDNLILLTIIIVLLVILNGIFSAGEIALISLRKSKAKELLKEKKDKQAARLLSIQENPERFLSAVQIGITLFGTLASAIGGTISVKYIKPLFHGIPFVKAMDDTLALIIVVVLLTYVFLIFGELVPKYIGINYKERVALFVLPIFEFTTRVLFIFVAFLTRSTMFVVNSLKLKKSEEQVGESEIKILLEEGRRKGVFDKTEEELIHSVFQFSDRSVKEVMVPKPNIYSIDIEMGRDEILRYVVENEFSRYPVYKDNLDNIIGIVYHKDITKQTLLQKRFDLPSILKKPYFVPETMGVSLLLKEMQKRRQHMAIVVDEYGTTVGIITLEDIMEEIFGEIMDETDVDDRIERLKDGSLIIDASYSIRDLNNMLHLALEESPDYETLSGLVLSKLQVIPKGGEIVYTDRYKLTVVNMEGRRIKKIRLEAING
ncbi:MAG: hemolysin family protein [Syntrophorhabdaceae bacterium]|nr:hemolysin family protein [Syntrophorhabdaceae bacterium]